VSGTGVADAKIIVFIYEHVYNKYAENMFRALLGFPYRSDYKRLNVVSFTSCLFDSGDEFADEQAQR
jgi:hypothetical protein